MSHALIDSVALRKEGAARTRSARPVDNRLAADVLPWSSSLLRTSARFPSFLC